jgi:hypothetical protein
MRGGHLAILRDAKSETKESEVAVSDIVPVPGAQFEETLASASPDLLRAMIREFAQRMMDADVEVACNAGYGEVSGFRIPSPSCHGGDLSTPAIRQSDALLLTARRPPGLRPPPHRPLRHPQLCGDLPGTVPQANRLAACSLSLARVMGPGCCREKGTAWRHE